MTIPIYVRVSLHPTRSTVACPSPASAIQSVFALFVHVSLIPAPRSIGHDSGIVIIPAGGDAQTAVHRGFRSVACLQIHGDKFQQHQREYDDCTGQLRTIIEREYICIHQIRCKRQHGKRDQRRRKRHEMRFHHRPVDRIDRRSPAFRREQMASADRYSDDGHSKDDGDHPQNARQQSDNNPVHPVLQSVIIITATYKNIRWQATKATHTTKRPADQSRQVANNHTCIRRLRVASAVPRASCASSWQSVHQSDGPWQSSAA